MRLYGQTNVGAMYRLQRLVVHLWLYHTTQRGPGPTGNGGSMIINASHMWSFGLQTSTQLPMTQAA